MPQIVQQSENGYDMLYQLAVLHGHPLVSASKKGRIVPLSWYCRYIVFLTRYVVHTSL
jgi:hypothetical protein